MENQSHFFVYHPNNAVNVKQDCLLYYHGPFNSRVIAQLSSRIKDHHTYSSHLIWKIYSIFIELVQNIQFHAAEFNSYPHTEPVGIIVIQEREGKVEITAANLMDNEHLRSMQDKCEQINRMNEAELRAYKSQLLLKAIEENYKGGNIGLIQVALLSKHKISTHLHQLNKQKSFFSVTASLAK
jgi:Family of unknown function (DUF6272)